MKKYYIGFIVLMAITLASLGYALGQAGAAKADKATDQAVEQIGTKLDEYSANHGGSIPQSLDALGVKDAPKTVSYQTMGASKYKICFDYHSASSGFDAGWASLLTGGITGGSQQTTVSPNGSYFDSSVETSHKKGNNCQTVSSSYLNTNPGSYASLQSSAATGASSVCLGDTSGYQVSGSLTVASVDQATSKITFSPDNQYVFDSTGNAVAPIASKNYTATTLFCDQSYNKSTIAAVQPGSTVQIYLDSAADNSVARVDAF